MKHINLSNGDKMPALGLGTWKSGKGEVYGAVTEAIKLGYRHIDCASAYENEAEVGLAIKDCISDGIVKREELWITSKLWNNMHGKDNVIVALKKTLTDLQLNYLDLYLIHWPVPLKPGKNFPMSSNDFFKPEEMPLENTWAGMEHTLELGLTKHIGVSNFSIKKIEQILNICKYKPEVNQIEIHPLLQQRKILEFCNIHGIILTAYSPLGSKDRHKSMKAQDEPDLIGNGVIAEIASKHKATPAQILLAWAIERNTSVIPKSVNPQRLSENMKALEINLDMEDMKKIESLDKNYRFVTGKFWVFPNGPHTLQSLWDE